MNIGESLDQLDRRFNFCEICMDQMVDHGWDHGVFFLDPINLWVFVRGVDRDFCVHFGANRAIRPLSKSNIYAGWHLDRGDQKGGSATRAIRVW